jgi:hypothetical protein
MMRDHVAPDLRELGFTGGSGTFTYAANGYDGVIRTQKDMRGTRLRTRFTLQVGAVGMDSIEVFRLMPGSGPDRWWELRAGEPAGPGRRLGDRRCSLLWPARHPGHPGRP